MTKCESFNWHTTSRVRNGLYDFGLLRDKLDTEEQKPKLFSIIFSRTVFIIAIIAGVTFMVCLILANKYQKSVAGSHHYASFINGKGREKFYLDRNQFNLTTGPDSSTRSEASILEFKTIQNVTKTIPIDEINHLMPITTVLHSVNNSSDQRTSRAASEKRADKYPNLKELNKNLSGLRLKDATNVSKNGANLVDLLRRTEAKTLPPEPDTPTTTEISGLQFAQLESYKHPYKVKNLQDILKYLYVNCHSSDNCVTKNNNDSENHRQEVDDDQDLDLDYSDFQQPKETINDNSIQDQPEDYLSNYISYTPEEDDLHFADSAVPVYFSPFFSGHQHQHQPQPDFDQLYQYRASSPVDINDLDQSESKNHHVGHRFSNRIYPRPELQEIPRLFTDGGLDAYLKPPTPPPTTISFTPSYTTAIFHGFNNMNAAAPHDEPKPEATSADPVALVKPISLMVEIFPATDYELPAFDSKRQLYVNQEEAASDVNVQANNPPWLPWKLSQYSPNRVRLHVNLFPQLTKPSNP